MNKQLDFTIRLRSFFLPLLNDAKPYQKLNALKFIRLVNEVTTDDESPFFKTVYQDAIATYPEMYFWQALAGDNFFDQLHLDEAWLRKLSKSKDNNVINFVASRTDCPVDVLEAFSLKESWLRVNVALNTECPKHILEQLAYDEEYDVRQYVAQNLNTPSLILDYLANDNNLRVRESVANNPNTSIPSLENLARDKQKDVRFAVATRDLPSHLLDLLAKDRANGIKELIANKDMLPVSTIEILAVDKNAYIRYLTAEHTNLSPSAFEILSKDDDFCVVAALLQNINLSDEIFQKLATQLAEHEDFRYRLDPAKNPRTSAEILVKLAEDEDESVLKAVAINSHTPVDALKKLAINKSSEVRSSLAQNIGLPNDVLKLLEKDDDLNVRILLTKSSSITTLERESLLNQELKSLISRLAILENEVIELLIDEAQSLTVEDKVVLVDQLLDFERFKILDFIDNPVISKKLKHALLLSIVINEDASDQIEVAQNESTPPEILARLAEECPWYTVNCCLAENKNTPEAILVNLAKGETGHGSIIDYKNSSLTNESLDKLAKSSSAKVRVNIAGHPRISTDALDYLANDLNFKVRWYVSKHVNTSEDTLRRLAGDEEVYIRLHVAEHPKTASEIKYKILLDLADHKLKEVRDAVNKILIEDMIKYQRDNLSESYVFTPEVKEIFRRLLSKEAEYLTIKSSNPLYRLIGLLSPLTSLKILQKYSTSDVAEERMAVACHPFTTKKILESLMQDSDEFVKLAAEQYFA